MTTPHNHPDINYNPAFFVGIGLNSLFVLAEIFYGIQANSVALLADALHNVSDVFSLVLAWVATAAAKRKPSQRFTYGYKSTTIAAAFINAALLFIAVGGVVWHAIERLLQPAEIAPVTVLVVAFIGVLINGITALMFMQSSKQDLNIRGAFLHLVTDAAASLSVVISSLLIILTSWWIVDPLISILISIATVVGTWGLFKESGNLLLQAVPAHIDANKVAIYFNTLPEVSNTHDLHIWALSTTEVALSVHLVMSKPPHDDFLDKVTQEIESLFAIHHVTIQIETAQNKNCLSSCS